MTRQDVISQACSQCMKDLYKYAVPHISWKQFVKECEDYDVRYEEWKDKSKNEWKGKPIEECIGPKPFEFYYLPKEILHGICDSYISIYRLDQKQELLDTIEILKNYCKNPIVKSTNKYGYEKPSNLEEELTEIFNPIQDCDGIEMAVKAQNKFFEFLDMAGKFYKWTRDLDAFKQNVYLGASPSDNREDVIKNWKKYRNKTIHLPDDKKLYDKYFE